jgi:DNA-binding response OmpR family regulator
MSICVYLLSFDPMLLRSLGEQLLAKGYGLAAEIPAADLLLLDDASRPAYAAIRRQAGARPLLALGLSPAEARAAGADDGLVKPFRFTDLLKCLEQLSLKEAIAVGDYRLDANAREMTDAAGRRLRLTEKEAAILVYLARAGDSAVARDELLGQVWGYANDASTHTVETHIYRLRRKLSENGIDGLVRTESGGYRLELPARR